MKKTYCDFCKRELLVTNESDKVHCGHYIVADEVCGFCLDEVRRVLIGWQKSKGYCSQGLLGDKYGMEEFKKISSN